MQGDRCDLQKQNSLYLDQLISTEFASANTCQAVSCGPESSAVSPGARCCFCATDVFEEYFKVGSVKA